MIFLTACSPKPGNIEGTILTFVPVESLTDEEIEALPQTGTFTIPPKPAPGVNVGLLEYQEEEDDFSMLGVTTTDALGHYSFNNLEPNRYAVILVQEVEGGWSCTYRAAQTVEADQDYILDFQLRQYFDFGVFGDIRLFEDSFGNGIFCGD